MENSKKIPESSRCELAKYECKQSSYVEIFKVLQSLRKQQLLCDIKLRTDDGGVIFGHKVVLASASPYFHEMFTNFEEKNQDIVLIKYLDSTTLLHLVDYIYTGEIVVTENNVKVLLPAVNIFQLLEVKAACCDFLQKKLSFTNCIGINSLADLHSCTELLTSSELYIQQHFSDVVVGDEFLFLSSEQIVKLIGSNELEVPSEEKVFENVIRWVKHDLGSRKCILPKLMEHVRLPLTSKEYILKKVVEEPLINNCLKCKDYVIEALNFYLLKSDELTTIPHNVRTKPRHPGGLHKVILVVGGLGSGEVILDSTEWYYPKINKWQSGPKMITPRCGGGVSVVKDNFVFYMGGINNRSSRQSIEVLDLSSEPSCWKPTVDMLRKRLNFGVGVIDNSIYAVGGFYGKGCLKSADVLNCRTQEWRKVANMSTRRRSVGIGVLNNLLYAVGGFDGLSKQRLNSVECYHPSLDKWKPVTEMGVRRSSVGVGVLNGVLYAVGGHDGLKSHKSAEAYRPSTGVWSTIPDMHSCRQNPGVAVLDGLLYVVSGSDNISQMDSVEFYNPTTNTWTIVTVSPNNARSLFGLVAIDSPRHFKTKHS